MARKKQKPKQKPKQPQRPKEKPQAIEPPRSRWHVNLLGLLFVLVQLVILPGAASTFRTPKDALVLAGIAVIVALGLIVRMARGEVRFPRSRLVAVLAVLPILQVISAFWSEDVYRALSSAGHSLLWVAAVAWIATLDEMDRDRLLGWCAAGAGLSGLVLLLQAAGIQMFGIVGAGGRALMTGLAGNPSDYSMTAAMLLPLLLLSVEEGSRRVVRWVLIGVLALATAVSVSLTGAAAIGLVLLVWLVKQRSRRVWLVAGGVTVLLIGVGLSSGLDHRLKKAGKQIRKGDWYAMFSARGDGWTAANEMIRTEPVSGVGAGNYTQRFYPSRLAWLDRHGKFGRRGEKASHFSWTHCDPLQHVAELGLLGGAWLLALIWTLARAAPRRLFMMALVAAGTLPMLLLHYPTHLALGLMPLVLILAGIASGDGTGVIEIRWKPLKWVAAALTIVVAGSAFWSQLQRMSIDVWRGSLNRRTAIAQQIPDAQQRRRATDSVENDVLRLVGGLPGEAPWLWRSAGKAQMIGGKSRAAEESFRRAYALWPHAEAEFGIGLALADQGRRSEALVHLGRVCRLNPELRHLIDDDALVRSVEDMLRTTRQRARESARRSGQ